MLLVLVLVLDMVHFWCSSAPFGDGSVLDLLMLVLEF
jgi:hypothetical protein